MRHRRMRTGARAAGRITSGAGAAGRIHPGAAPGVVTICATVNAGWPAPERGRGAAVPGFGRPQALRRPERRWARFWSRKSTST
jgi:hypothetical protein